MVKVVQPRINPFMGESLYFVPQMEQEIFVFSLMYAVGGKNIDSWLAIIYQLFSFLLLYY